VAFGHPLVDVDWPHTLGVPPPPHVSGAVHEPQASVPPQPSEMEPQFFPWAAHVVGVHEPVGVTLKPETATSPESPILPRFARLATVLWLSRKAAFWARATSP
jgi:hypothetical protein